MTETDTAPPPFAPPVRPPLRRSRRTSMVGGVCGGLAEHTGIDVLLFRVGFAVLTLAGGAGLVLYAALWLLVPDPDGVPGPLRRWTGHRTGTRVRDVLLLVVAFVVTAAVLGSWGADGGVLGLLAVGLIAYLWVRDRDSRARRSVESGPPPAPEGTGPTGPADQPTAWVLADQDPGSSRGPRPPRSRLGALTVSAMFLALGVVAVADVTTDLSVSTAAYLGVALGVVGLGLVVGTFLGRSRGLIFLGVVVLALLVPVSTLEVDLRDGLGERVSTPSTPERIEPVYRLGAGHVLLDLSRLDFTGAAERTRITVNTGYAEILLPRDVDVTVTASVRGGEIDLFDSTRNGSSLERSVTDDGADGPGGGTLDLVVDVNLGVVEVSRVG